jgi:tetratricopeptide (TPR) repeat protein
MYQLGNTYYQQANLGGGRDYSTATQTLQRMLKEYPSSPYLQLAKQLLTEIEIASLPPEQQQAARQQAVQQAVQAQMQQTIDLYNKQLAECKGDPCAAIMYQFGTTLYQQIAGGGRRGGPGHGDYSMAIQIFQRLLKEYPTSPYSNAAKQMLAQIETMQKSGK